MRADGRISPEGRRLMWRTYPAPSGRASPTKTDGRAQLERRMRRVLTEEGPRELTAKDPADDAVGHGRVGGGEEGGSSVVAITLELEPGNTRTRVPSNALCRSGGGPRW